MSRLKNIKYFQKNKFTVIQELKVYLMQIKRKFRNKAIKKLKNLNLKLKNFRRRQRDKKMR